MGRIKINDEKLKSDPQPRYEHSGQKPPGEVGNHNMAHNKRECREQAGNNTYSH